MNKGIQVLVFSVVPVLVLICMSISAHAFTYDLDWPPSQVSGETSYNSNYSIGAVAYAAPNSPDTAEIWVEGQLTVNPDEWIYLNMTHSYTLMVDETADCEASTTFMIQIADSAVPGSAYTLASIGSHSTQLNGSAVESLISNEFFASYQAPGQWPSGGSSTPSLFQNLFSVETNIWLALRLDPGTYDLSYYLKSEAGVGSGGWAVADTDMANLALANTLPGGESASGTYDFTTVPIPSGVLLLSTGLIGLAGIRKKLILIV